MNKVLLVAVLLLAGCSGLPGEDGKPDAAGTAPVPDPLVAGMRQVTRLEYDFGRYVVDDSSLALFHYDVPLHGSLHLPDGAGPAPLVVLLHGRHVTCSYAGTEFLGPGVCPDAVVVEPVDSYTGYDGLAEGLASWGYAVASIDANTINDRDLAGDAGANARAAVVLRTLDELASVNATGHGLGSIGGLPMEVPANTPERDVSAAQGRLDLSRVGLMGHSRGGEGVARAVGMDAQRHGGAHGIDAVFALAPTDFARWPVPGVAFATLLPYCDGDVSNLQGAWMYDDARRLEPAAPRHQVLAMGADHNFYNTVWTGDDWGTQADPWCNPDETTTGRDTPEQQRAHGYGLMASFFRLYVGGESAFAPMWDGADSVFPASLCPDRPSCAGRLHASAMPVRRLDLTASPGVPARAEGIEAEPCDPSECPSQPVDAGGRLAAWTCGVDGRARFAVADLQDWDAFSLRVGGRNGTAPRLWLEALPGGAVSADLQVPSRPGGEAGAKTVLSEVRVPLAGLGVEGTSELVLHCGAAPGTGEDILVTDLMLV